MKALDFAILAVVALPLRLSAGAAVQLREFAGQAPEKAYPVSRVVELLRDMKTTMEKEQKADEEVYEKIACWCETNDKEKTKSISDAEARLSDLGATIDKMGALSDSLEVEIEGLEKEVAKNVRALEVATALRKKQAAEFHEDEKEMLQSIQALGAAIVVLSKHHGGAALLSDSGSQKEVREAAGAAHAALLRHAALLQGIIKPSQKRLLEALVQAPGYSGQSPTFKQKYNPQSGEIFGILSQMKETFETDLSQSQKQELEDQKAYEELKVAKETEIKTGQENLEDKQEQLADAKERLADAKQDKEDTLASLSADQKFLLVLKEKCSMTDSEWEARQKARAEELAAVAKAIGILSSDDARDLFSKTFNAGSASLLQENEGRKYGHARGQAASILAKAATATGNKKLAALSVRVQSALDPFTKVIEAIDKLVGELEKEGADEIKHRDYCIDGLNTNERDTAKEVHTKTNLEAKIDGLKLRVKELEATIETLKKEIEDLNTQKQRAKEDRAIEKKEFEALVADQRATQDLLQKALGALEDFYGKQGFLQKSVQVPPASFTKYETQKEGASPVMVLLGHILEGTKAMEAEAIKDENEAVSAYQDFVKETDASIKAKGDAITDRSGELSTTKTDLGQAEDELDTSVDTLESLAKTKAGLHGECDYYIKNFDVRQEARDQEIQALKEAKAFLEGMKKD